MPGLKVLFTRGQQERFFRRVWSHFQKLHEREYGSPSKTDELLAVQACYLLQQASRDDAKAVCALIDQAFADRWATVVGIEIGQVFHWWRARHPGAPVPYRELERESAFAGRGSVS